MMVDAVPIEETKINHKVLGGYPIVWFVYEISESFICSICSNVLKNPQQCKTGHNFCLTCITGELEKHKACPICHTYLDTERLSNTLFIRDMVNQLPVRCINENCEWTGKLKEHDRHIEECPYELIDCPLHGFRACHNCDGHICRDELQDHINTKAEEFGHIIISKLLAKLENVTKENELLRQVIPSGYIGEKLNEDPHGYGVIKERVIHPHNTTQSSSTTRIGYFQHGVSSGYGICHDDDGTYYGNYKEDLRSGHGRMEYVNGDVYDGDWLEDCPHGKGKMTYSSGSVYTGDWFEGHCQGHGEIVRNNGASYIGEFLQDVYNGQGVLSYPDGSAYEGAFVNGKLHGEILYRYIKNGELVVQTFDASRLGQT